MIISQLSFSQSLQQRQSGGTDTITDTIKSVVSRASNTAKIFSQGGKQVGEMIKKTFGGFQAERVGK